MHCDGLSRREFHKLSAAVLGGLIAGTALGCAQSQPEAKTRGTDPTPKDRGSADSPSSKPARNHDDVALAATSVSLHACRGLNECKQQGRDHKNDCAGKGNCYTARHECSGQNACKNQGGCGDTMGMNDCKGKGGCGHLPISDEAAWKKARNAFEKRMKTAGKSVGPAPAPAKS